MQDIGERDIDGRPGQIEKRVDAAAADILAEAVEVAQFGPAGAAALPTADGDRLANQVIIGLLVIGAIVLLILIFRLFRRSRPRVR